MTQSLTQLIEQLEKVEAGSRELSRGVWLAAGQQMLKSPTIRPGKEVPDESCPPVTTSLDAANALVERVLPGWGRKHEVPADNMDRKVINVTLWRFDEKLRGPMVSGSHTSEPLALCIALLRALQAKEAGQ